MNIYQMYFSFHLRSEAWRSSSSMNQDYKFGTSDGDENMYVPKGEFQPTCLKQKKTNPKASRNYKKNWGRLAKWAFSIFHPKLKLEVYHHKEVEKLWQ